MTGLSNLGTPIRYIGKKARKEDNVAFTGLYWAPGQVHIVPPIIAERLLRHADIWAVADDTELQTDPAAVGIVVTEGDIQKPEQGQRKPFDLPNLQGMTKPDLQAYALGEFGVQIDGREKKESMINQIVTLANREDA